MNIKVIFKIQKWKGDIMPRKKKEEVIEAVICEDKTDDENNTQ